MEIAVTVVVFVDVDVAVALLHLAGAGGDDVDAAPGGVGDEVHAVRDCLVHGLDVLAEVVDAVAVVELAVLAALVDGTEAVLHDHDGHLVAVPDLIEAPAQAFRVDGPAPIGLLEVRVGHAHDHVAAALRDRRIGGDAVGHVVAVGVHVHGALAQDGLVAVEHGHVDLVVGKVAQGITGIVTAALHVRAEPGADLQLLLGGEHVRRRAGVGVDGRATTDHAADHILRVNLVREFDGKSAREELMVQRGIDGGQLVLVVGGRKAHGHDVLLGQDAARDEGAEAAVLQHVDLVEGEPVLHQALVLGEDGTAQVEEEVDAAAVRPAVVLLGEAHGDLVVADGDERLDAPLLALREHGTIELDACLVGLGLVAHWIEAAPVDGRAEDLHAHLAEELDVLLVVPVEVDRLVARIVGVRVDDAGIGARTVDRPARQVVLDALALAVS